MANPGLIRIRKYLIDSNIFVEFGKITNANKFHAKKLIRKAF